MVGGLTTTALACGYYRTHLVILLTSRIPPEIEPPGKEGSPWRQRSNFIYVPVARGAPRSSSSTLGTIRKTDVSPSQDKGVTSLEALDLADQELGTAAAQAKEVRS